MKSGRIIKLIWLLAGLWIALAEAGDASIHPDLIRAFADHLYQQQDYLRAAIEYERFLYLTGQTQDSILFKIGLCHQFRGRYDYAAASFNRILGADDSALRPQARLAVLTNYYLLRDWQAIHQFGFETDDEYYFTFFAALQTDSLAGFRPNFEAVRNDSLRLRLAAVFETYQHRKPKLPMMAATLSALVPGLGKWYCSRPGDGLFAAGMTGLAAIVTWRAFVSEVVVTGVITGGITLAFYLGGIYGSYIGAQLYNDDLRQKVMTQLEMLNPVSANPYWTAW